MPTNKKNTRKCIVCRQHADKSELVRFVKIDGKVVLDTTQKLGGRGVWVHNDEQCIKKFKTKRMLSSAFKMQVGDEIYDLI